MAHFKRKTARSKARCGYDRKCAERRAARRGEQVRRFYTWEWEPRAHHIVFHTRPRRCYDAAEVRRILNGKDPEGAIFPLGRKPHVYFWWAGWSIQRSVAAPCRGSSGPS